MAIRLKQSVDALAERVVRKASEYPRIGVALWICHNGSAHVVPLKDSVLSGPGFAEPCQLIGHYRAPCEPENIAEDIEWVMRAVRMGRLH
jgi:hypothetical protein